MALGYDGSIRIDTKIDGSGFSKGLGKMSADLEKKVKDSEKLLEDLQKKREELSNTSIIKVQELDKEKAKLDILRRNLEEIKAVAKDTSFSEGARAEAKSKIPRAQEDYRGQQERVRLLQSEWNRIESSIQTYTVKIEEASQKLQEQRIEAQKISESFDGEVGKLEEINAAAEVGSQRIVDLSHKLAELQERQKLLESAGLGLGYQEYDENLKKISGITDELKKYQDTLKSVQDSTAGDTLGGFSDSAGKLIDTLQKIGPLLSDGIGGATDEVLSMLSKIPGKVGLIATAVKVSLEVVEAVAKKINERLQKNFDQMKQAVQVSWKAISAAAKTTASVFGKTFSASAKGVSALTKGLKAVANGITSAAKNMNVFSKLSSSLENVFKQLGSTIKSALVFSVIYQGLSMVRSEMGAYLMVNQQFVAALAQIKGVLLTAFQPIYDVVVPALTTLMNMLSSVIAAISQFTASLFGTTAKKAQKNAESLYKQAHAMEAVGGAAASAAKEAETAVAAFDEFNILSFPDTSGGGGGGGGAAGIEMPDFDYEYDEAQFDSWGEAFSAFLDKLLDGIPKLEEAFKKFADWLNGFSQKLYDMFKFPGVLEKVERLGRDLAGAFNKLVNWIDWNLLGKALGAGLNLALQFLTEFLYAFGWMNLGRKLAEFVNGLASEIDWYDFGRLLWAGFKIALETLAGFIVGLDMPLMAQAASNIIMGFFDEMKNTIQRIPWYKIGSQIAAFLNNINWYDTLTSVIQAIQAALRAMQQLLAGFVDTLHWSDIATQIYTAINDSFGNINWRHMGQTLGDAFVHVFDFVRTIVSGIHWYDIGKGIADFILGFDFVSALSSLGQLIAAGINAAVGLVRGFLDNITPQLKSIAEGIAQALKETVQAVDWTMLGGVIGDGIKAALTFVAGLLSPDTFYAIGKAIGDFFVGLDWIGIIGGLTQVLSNAINSAVAAVKGFLDSVQPNLKSIADGIAEKINKFFQDVDWEDLGKTISRGIETALDFMIELVQQIDWDQVGEAITDLFTNIDWDTLLEKWGKLFGELLSAKMKALDISAMYDVGFNIVEGLWNGMWEKFNAGGGVLGMIKRLIIDRLIDDIKRLLGIHSPSTVFAEIGENLIAGLLQGITETWNSIVEFFQEKINSMIEFFSSAWDGLKEKTSAAWESIKNALGEIWDSIREAAGTAFESIRDTISNAWDTLKEKTSAIWEGIKEALSALWESIKEKASTIFDAIKTTISNIWENVKNVTSTIWEGIKTTLSNLWDSLKEKATAIFENIKTAISAAWENIKAKTSEIWNTIKTTLETLWNNLKTTVTNIFNEIKNKIVEVWTNIKNEAVNKWNEITSTIQNKISEIKAKVVEGFTAIKETIVGKIKDAMDSLKNMDWLSVGRSIVDGILNGLHGIFEKLRDWASDVWDSVTSAFSGGGSKRSSVSRSSSRTRSAASYRMAPVPAGYEAYQIPKLANGAVIPPNQQFLAILGDQRRGMNIEAPLSTIEQALQNVMDRNGGVGGSRGPIEINLTVDKRVLARVIVPEINDMTRAAGKPVLLF